MVRIFNQYFIFYERHVLSRKRNVDLSLWRSQLDIPDLISANVKAGTSKTHDILEPESNYMSSQNTIMTSNHRHNKVIHVQYTYIRNSLLPLLNLRPVLPPPRIANRPFTDQTIKTTGANVGLGLKAPQHIVCLGETKTILAVRNTTAGYEARQSIGPSTNRPGIYKV